MDVRFELREINFECKSLAVHGLSVSVSLLLMNWMLFTTNVIICRLTFSACSCTSAIHCAHVNDPSSYVIVLAWLEADLAYKTLQLETFG